MRHWHPGGLSRYRRHLLPLLGLLWLLTPFALARAQSCQIWSQFAHPGLLWALQGPGDQRGYLFGTMHSDQRGVVAYADRLMSRLTRSNLFIMETRITPRAARAMSNAMRLPPGARLEPLLGEALYRRARAAYARRGWPMTLLDHEKPWAVLLTVSVPPNTGPVLDEILAARAAAAGLPVVGLETTEEQIEVLDNLPLPAQRALLSQALSDDETKDLRALESAYERDDLNALVATAQADQGPDAALFTRRLLHDRNRRMARRLLRTLPDHVPFVAVGALHLPGLLRRLAKAGVCATPLAITPSPTTSRDTSP